MTNACLAWEFAQLVQNNVFHTIKNFPRCTPVRDLHTAFNLPYVYDYIIKLLRQQAELIQYHENEYVRSIGQGETRHRNYKRLSLNLVVVKPTTLQMAKLTL
jgi:hypothetical protein